MQTPNIGHQLHLHWRKIAVICLLMSLGVSSQAQNNPSDHLVNYDNQWIHYGFLIGIHSSKYVTKYSDAFTSPAMDTVHSIVPGNLGGFKVGFLANMKITPYLDFRGSVTIGFYEYDLTYRYTNNTEIRELKDPTMVEFPLLLKYKSARRGNLAMYMLGGINPSFEAVGKDSQQDIKERLEIKNFNVAAEFGLGFDIYYPYFKFSPEIRYSWGLTNMLSDTPNEFSVGLSRLVNQNLTIFVTFEGGPTTKKKLGKKTRGAGQIRSHKKKKPRS